MTRVERFYEELEHTADWAIRVWGDDLAGLFEHAAEAMFELQGADLAGSPTLQDEVTCASVDAPALLVRWLNELLYLSEMRNALYTRFRVHLQPTEDEIELRATVWGGPARGPLAHVKAVTYYDLSVTQTAAGWEATVTFDT